MSAAIRRLADRGAGGGSWELDPLMAGVVTGK